MCAHMVNFLNGLKDNQLTHNTSLTQKCAHRKMHNLADSTRWPKHIEGQWQEV